MPGPYKLGKLAATRPHSLSDLSDYLTSKPPQPRSSVPVPDVASWPMDFNDQLGCCVMAGCAHELQAFDALVSEKDAVPSEEQVKDLYLQLTGGQDTGLNVANTLATWQRKGLWGNRIKAYAPVGINILDLHLAIDLFGVCKLGIQCPQSAQEQFAAGEPWTVVKGSPIEGGHDVEAVGYDSEYLYIVTWGAVARMSYPFAQSYIDEAWAIVAQEYVEAGRGPQLDLAALEHDMPVLDR